MYTLLCICDFTLFNGLLLTMNASSWKKAADIIAKVTPADPQVQAAAMAESQNFAKPPTKHTISR